MEIKKLEKKSPKGFQITCVFIVFIALGFISILNHEMWLDETHHWLLAKNSNSISELFFNLRYEGHPALWNVLLFFLTRFTDNPFAMQILNLIIAGAAVVVFLLNAPFAFYQKTLIVFGYFIFYEYTSIARNYALVFLLVVLVCTFFKNRHEIFLKLTGLLALLAQAHLFAAIFALGIFLILVHEKFILKKREFNFFYFGSSLFIVSCLLVIAQVIPPKDHFLFTFDDADLLSFKRFGKALSVIWKGLFPIPNFFTAYPWNSNFVISYSKQLAIVPVALSWLVPLIILNKNKTITVFYYLTALALCVFIYFSPLIVSARHCGFFFLLLIVGLWLSKYLSQNQHKQNRSNTFNLYLNNLSKPIFNLILIIQCVAACYLFYFDFTHNFSNGKNAAQWLIKNTNKNSIIVVNNHFAGPSISAYLNKKVYYAEGNSFGSYCKWNTKPFLITHDTLFSRTCRLLNESPQTSLFLITNRPLRISNLDTNLIVLKARAQFLNALIYSEDYYITEMVKK